MSAITDILEEILKANTKRDAALKDLITAVKNLNARVSALENLAPPSEVE